MTPQFEAGKERIQGFATKWERLMDMAWLSVKHTYNPNVNEESPFIVATTQADWEYRAGVIDWNMPRVCAIEDDTLESVVVHELSHILLNPLEQLATKPHEAPLVEFAAESMARALLSVHRGSNGNEG